MDPISCYPQPFKPERLIKKLNAKKEKLKKKRSVPSQMRSSLCLFTLCLSVRDMAFYKPQLPPRTPSTFRVLVHSQHCSPGHNAEAHTPARKETGRVVISVLKMAQVEVSLSFCSVSFSTVSNYLTVNVDEVEQTVNDALLMSREFETWP